jgi:hypothetical protein
MIAAVTALAYNVDSPIGDSYFAVSIWWGS